MLRQSKFENVSTVPGSKIYLLFSYCPHSLYVLPTEADDLQLIKKLIEAFIYIWVGWVTYLSVAARRYDVGGTIPSAQYKDIQ